MNSLCAFFMKVEPFSKLPVSELERLSLMVQVTHHAKGESLFTEGEEANHKWLLQAGQLQIFKYSSEGRPFAIDSVEPQQLFGTLDRLGIVAALTYPCTAIATRDSTSIKIPDRIFQSLYTRYPAMIASICGLCSERLNLMQERALDYQEPVRQRLVKVLFQLRQRSHGNVLNFTKREISELAGTTVETAIRVLSEFQKKHWIASRRGEVTLRNVPGLQHLLADHTKTPSRPAIRTHAVA